MSHEWHAAIRTPMKLRVVNMNANSKTVMARAGDLRARVFRMSESLDRLLALRRPMARASERLDLLQAA
jgi:hypothetical protein